MFHRSLILVNFEFSLEIDKMIYYNLMISSHYPNKNHRWKLSIRLLIDETINTQKKFYPEKFYLLPRTRIAHKKSLWENIRTTILTHQPDYQNGTS